jgi:hypothetical protein
LPACRTTATSSSSKNAACTSVAPASAAIATAAARVPSSVTTMFTVNQYLSLSA